MWISFQEDHSRKRLSFLRYEFLALLWEINWLYMNEFISGLSILFNLPIMSVFMLIPYWFDYFSFAICFETRKCKASSFVLLKFHIWNILCISSCVLSFFNSFRRYLLNACYAPGTLLMLEIKLQNKIKPLTFEMMKRKDCLLLSPPPSKIPKAISFPWHNLLWH
jgi:hypothetical protein